MGKISNVFLSAAMVLLFAAQAQAAPTAAKSTKPAGPPAKSATKSTGPVSKIKTCTADGKAPVWLSLPEGLKAAKATGKYAVVDVYTDWCHYCHKLDKEVFSVPPVAPYLAENFVCIRINAEDGAEGQAFATKLGVRAFPTSLFLDSNGGALAGVGIPGFVQSAEYLKRLEEVAALKAKGVKGQTIQ